MQKNIAPIMAKMKVPDIECESLLMDSKEEYHQYLKYFDLY